jgi:hypothetical protein
MPELASEAAARTVLENIDLWVEYALSAKDFVPAAPDGYCASLERKATVLDDFYEIHRWFMSGAVSEITWNDAKKALGILISTTWFRNQWELRKAQCSEEFAHVIQDACTSVVTRRR